MDEFEARIWTAFGFSPDDAREITQSDWYREMQLVQFDARAQEAAFRVHMEALAEAVTLAGSNPCTRHHDLSAHERSD